MSDKPGVVECSEALVDHYGVTFTCLGSSLDKLNSKQEVLAVRVHQEVGTLTEEWHLVMIWCDHVPLLLH